MSVQQIFQAKTFAQLTPIRPWFRSVTPATLRYDAIAGMTNAAIVLPQGVAFAIVAGLPPEYGLFTAMVTTLIAAIWGSSMVMVSGPTTAISAVLFACLFELAPPDTPSHRPAPEVEGVERGHYRLESSR